MIHIEQNKFRHEYKYQASDQHLVQVMNRIGPLCQSDPNTDSRGIYRVRSLYFDDMYDTCYYENEGGTDPREKFRIRIYPGNNAGITLELKRKEKGKTLKTSCPISEEECRSLMIGKTVEPGDRFLLKKLYILMQTRGMEPRIIVEYERRPLIYPLGNVRVTFDRNIAMSGDLDLFLNEDIPLRPILPASQHILEVKFDEFLPDPIKWAVSMPDLKHSAFSKYYICAYFNKLKMEN